MRLQAWRWRAELARLVESKKDREHLAPHNTPRYWVFVDQFP